MSEAGPGSALGPGWESGSGLGWESESRSGSGQDGIQISIGIGIGTGTWMRTGIRLETAIKFGIGTETGTGTPWDRDQDGDGNGDQDQDQNRYRDQDRDRERARRAPPGDSAALPEQRPNPGPSRIPGTLPGPSLAPRNLFWSPRDSPAGRGSPEPPKPPHGRCSRAGTLGDALRPFLFLLFLPRAGWAGGAWG